MGICVYLFFRDLAHVIFFAWVPLPDVIKPVLIELPPSIFSYIVLHNAAGMLWVMSGIMFFRVIWFSKPQTQRAYIGCFFAAAVLMEISQVSKRVPGTFDFFDLLFMGIGALIEGLLYTIFIKRRIA